MSDMAAYSGARALPGRPCGNCPSSVGRAQYRSPARLPSGCIPLQLCRRANAFQAAASQGRPGAPLSAAGSLQAKPEKPPCRISAGRFCDISRAFPIPPWAPIFCDGRSCPIRNPAPAGLRKMEQIPGKSRGAAATPAENRAEPLSPVRAEHRPRRPAPSSAIPGRSRLSCSPTLHAAELTDSQTHPFPAPAPAICAEACPAGHPPAPQFPGLLPKC